MNKIIILFLIALNLISKPAVAVEKNLLMTEDGNVWEVLDELKPGKEYTIIFDTQGDKVPENDEIIRVWDEEE